jgi:hypothetical protein
MIAIAIAAGLSGRATLDAGRRRCAASLARCRARLQEADTPLRALIAAPTHTRNAVRAARHPHRTAGGSRVAGLVMRDLVRTVSLDGGLGRVVVDGTGGRALLVLRGAREVGPKERPAGGVVRDHVALVDLGLRRCRIVRAYALRGAARRRSARPARAGEKSEPSSRENCEQPPATPHELESITRPGKAVRIDSRVRARCHRHMSDAKQHGLFDAVLEKMLPLIQAAESRQP